MALPLITVNITEPKDDVEAIRQLAAAIVAKAFNDYMEFTMFPVYVNQLRVIRECLYGWAVSDGWDADECLDRALDLMQLSFFRRMYKMRRKIMRNGIDRESVTEHIQKLDGIIAYEEHIGCRNARNELERLDRFFRSSLYSLYSGNAVDLDTALARCDDEINKEKERTR